MVKTSQDSILIADTHDDLRHSQQKRLDPKFEQLSFIFDSVSSILYYG